MDNQRKWWKETVFYQIYPLSFKDKNCDGKGDIRGIIEKLGYLKDLGIGALWISPIYASAMFDNGYDIYNYKSIDKIFGTIDDFDELIQKTKKLNIKIIMDLVINHTSHKHPWFLESAKGKNNPKSDYYIWRDGISDKEPNNWAADFGGSAWTWHPKRKQYYLHLFSKYQPDLNWHNPEVKENIFEMMRWWLMRGVDGFRMDMGNFLFKAKNFPNAPKKDEFDNRKYIHGESLYANQPGIHELLKEMRQKVLNPFDAILYGEMYFLSPEKSLEYVSYDNNEVNILYEYPIMDARGNWNEIKKQIRLYNETFNKKAWNSITFSNHDSPRSVSVLGDEKNYHNKSAKFIFTFLLTSHGTPFFLQGEEIGMTNIKINSPKEFTDIKMINIYNERLKLGEDPKKILEDLSFWNRDNARTPMQWSSDKWAGFSCVEPWIEINPNYKNINVENELIDDDSILNYVKKLIRFRNKNKALIYGDFSPLCPDDWTVYGYTRKLNNDIYSIMFNFSSNDNNIKAPWSIQDNKSEFLFGNYEVKYDVLDILYMKPWECRIYKYKN